MLNSDILYNASDNLEKLTGFSVKAEISPNSSSEGDDGTIIIRKNGIATQLEAKIKRDVHQSNLLFILDQFKGEKNSIIVARYISSPGKKVLEENLMYCF